MTCLLSLPLDILLEVFQELDVVGSIRLGMTCKGLYQILQDRQVWADQLKRLRHEDPVLKPATYPPAPLSAEELKAIVIGRIKLRHRFNDDNKNLGFATKCVTKIPGICETMLLPGGRSLLAVDGSAGNVTLHRIRLEDDQVSLSVAANINVRCRGSVRAYEEQVVHHDVALSSSRPFLRKASTVWIINIDHHGGAMSLETTLRLPGGCGIPGIGAQGRVIGFVVQPSRGPGRLVAIHLDNPGATVEVEIPHANALLSDPRSSWAICMPAENLAIVYNTKDILACKIPIFSDLSPGMHTMNARPMWSRPGLDRYERDKLDLYYVKTTSQVITVTVPINTSDDNDDANQAPELGGLPALERESTFIEEGWPGWGTYDCCNKGLHVRRFLSNQITYVIVPLKNLASRSPGDALWMSVDHEGSEGPMVDVDEASGRVVLSGDRDRSTQETRII